MSVIHVTDANYKTEIEDYSGTVLLDFYADWCGPCKMLSPIIEAIADEHSEIKVGKVNVDTETELAKKYGVMSIPTVAVLVDGKVKQVSVGFKPKTEILKMLGL